MVIKNTLDPESAQIIAPCSSEPPQSSLATRPVENRESGDPSGVETLPTETPQNSLENTEVSQGHSHNITDSKKLIREEWGTRGTMHKIYRCIKSGSSPVDVPLLVSEGPVVSGQSRFIAAQCFTSILNLKQRGLIKIHKDPVTLEIKDIELGDKIVWDK